MTYQFKTVDLVRTKIGTPVTFNSEAVRKNVGFDGGVITRVTDFGIVVQCGEKEIGIRRNQVTEAE